jgi:hypothetical protein
MEVLSTPNTLEIFLQVLQQEPLQEAPSKMDCGICLRMEGRYS